MLFTDKRAGKDFSKDPCVVALGGKYYLYYSIWQNIGGENKLGIGIAVSADMENWDIVGEIPLTQKCEEKGIGCAGAVVLDGVTTSSTRPTEIGKRTNTDCP